jgi:gas vesicle protein
MENKFTKGLILGGVLMAAAVAIFATSKEGKELSKKLKEDVKQMSIHMKDNFGKLRDVSKEDFDELVTTLVDEYAKKKELGDESKKKIVNLLKSKWNEVKDGFANEA